jgi:hypothetical protein
LLIGGIHRAISMGRSVARQGLHGADEQLEAELEVAVVVVLGQLRQQG